MIVESNGAISSDNICSYTIFYFFCRILKESIQTECLSTAEEIVCDFYGPAATAELVAKARMPCRILRRRGSAFTHTGCLDCASSPWRKCDRRFIAIASAAELRTKVQNAEEAWAQEQTRLTTIANQLQHLQRDAKLCRLPPRVAAKIVVQDDGCWKWTAARSGSGYGVVSVDGKHRAAHRYVFEALVTQIPPGALLRHTCDKPSCVNPSHLVPGTAKQNVDDMILRGRAVWQCNVSPRKR